MNNFHIPDIDLLEQIYEIATVRLAPNDAESATITFDTGVAQGSITSPQLFNIFINSLLRMLTATWQNRGSSHGLQIGKDQDDSSQALFLASLRFCVHYCIYRDTVQKKKSYFARFFVVMSTTDLKMIWKQTTIKKMYLI